MASIHAGQSASGRDSPVTMARVSTKALTSILLSEYVPTAVASTGQYWSVPDESTGRYQMKIMVGTR